MKNYEVSIDGEYVLSGTLTIPDVEDSKFPAVLIIAGSGDADRDGNMPGMPMNIYKELAQYLTSKGFATLRYDKRGTHKSEGDYYATGFYDLIEDAAQCVKFLKNHANINEKKVFILGHSEGALIAPVVQKIEPVSGLILLAGAAVPAIELLKRQNEMVFKELYGTKGFINGLLRILKVPERSRKKNEKIYKMIDESDQDIMNIQGLKINAKWMRELRKFNVCDYLKEVTSPVLAITGEKDIQVPPEHAKQIAELVKGEAEWHVIPNMNHVFRIYDGQHTMLGLMKEYVTLLNQPIAGELLEIIEAWLNKQLIQGTKG